MNVRLWVLVLIFAGLLSACVPTPQVDGVLGSAPTTTLSAMTAFELPCAGVRQRYINDALRVTYDAQSIYRKGAVLPKREGLACLDVLVDWLKNTPKIAWQVSVGGEGATSIEALAVADKRQELMKRYFLRKGIDITGWTWQSVRSHDFGQLRLDELRDRR